MSAIPNSSLPGHKQLHERVTAALDLCQESQDLEFKESTSWNDLKVNIARTAMAMANLRDGGIVVIGVSERNGEWSLTGIRQEDLETYVEDEINDFVNRYASPPLRLELVLVEYRNVQFLAVRAPEFDRTPIICKKNGDDTRKLREGGIYIRQPGKPGTTLVVKAEDIERLLELAAEKRAKAMLLTARRLGMTLEKSDKESFDEELGGL